MMLFGCILGVFQTDIAQVGWTLGPYLWVGGYSGLHFHLTKHRCGLSLRVGVSGALVAYLVWIPDPNRLGFILWLPHKVAYLVAVWAKDGNTVPGEHKWRHTTSYFMYLVLVYVE